MSIHCGAGRQTIQPRQSPMEKCSQSAKPFADMEVATAADMGSMGKVRNWNGQTREAQ